MTVLVLDGDLLGEGLARAGEDEAVVAVASSAARLEALERAWPDPRVLYLIGEAEVLPLPDASVDVVLGAGCAEEIRRVLRR